MNEKQEKCPLCQAKLFLKGNQEKCLRHDYLVDITQGFEAFGTEFFTIINRWDPVSLEYKGAKSVLIWTDADFQQQSFPIKFRRIDPDSVQKAYTYFHQQMQVEKTRSPEITEAIKAIRGANVSESN